MPPKKRAKIGRRLKKRMVKVSPKTKAIPKINDPSECDTFLASCLRGLFFLADDDDYSLVPFPEFVDSDGFRADQFIVILDRCYRYSPGVNLDELVSYIKITLLRQLKETCQKLIDDKNFVLMKNSKDIRYVQLYDCDENFTSPRVKACVAVNKDLNLQIVVHRKIIESCHHIWKSIGHSCYTAAGLKKVLCEFGRFKICTGNNDIDLQELLAFEDEGRNFCGYREKDYIGSTIRSKSCLMVYSQSTSRCSNCQIYRRTLLKTFARKSSPKIETLKKDWTKCKNSNNKLTHSQMLDKIKQLKSYSHGLEVEVGRLKKEIKKKLVLRTSAVKLSFVK